TVRATGADAGDPLSVVRATAHAAWAGGGSVTVAAGDDTARAALQRWSLLT
ncbi:HAD family hydrolase, partial [Xylella fastidiosa subsp. multiplex]|nr:HAD family hydrolase [Xylella fastidiosa subsp. multiplex]